MGPTEVSDQRGRFSIASLDSLSMNFAIPPSEGPYTSSYKYSPTQESTPKGYTWRQLTILLILCFGNFCVGMSVSLQAPFFPQEAEKKGATPLEYGFIFGIYQFVMFLTSPLFGKLVAFMSAKFMLNTGMFVVGASSILFALLDQSPRDPFVPLAIAIRTAEGIGSVAIKTASYTALGVHFPGRIAKTFSYLETSLGIGLIAGPTIGGGLHMAGGFELPFFIAGAMMLGAALITLIVLPNDGENIPEKSGDLLRFWCNIDIIIRASVVFVCFTFILSLAATLEPHLRQFNLTPFTLGCIFVLGGGMYACSAPIWGRICERTKNLYCITFIGTLLMGINWMLIGPVSFIPLDTTLWMVIVSLIFYGCALGSKLVSSFLHSFRVTLGRDFPDDQSTYGLVSSMYTGSSSLGGFVGPVVAGYLLETLGFKSVCGIYLLVEAVLACIIAIRCSWIYCDKSHSTRQEKQPLLQSTTSNV